MRVQLESTDRIVELQIRDAVVPARVWVGKTERGIRVFTRSSRGSRCGTTSIRRSSPRTCRNRPSRCPGTLSARFPPAWSSDERDIVREYVCAACGGRFECVEDDDERANDEARRLFGRDCQADDMEIVCDDCFREMAVVFGWETA